MPKRSGIIAEVMEGLEHLGISVLDVDLEEKQTTWREEMPRPTPESAEPESAEPKSAEPESAAARSTGSERTGPAAPLDVSTHCARTLFPVDCVGNYVSSCLISDSEQGGQDSICTLVIEGVPPVGPGRYLALLPSFGCKVGCEYSVLADVTIVEEDQKHKLVVPSDESVCFTGTTPSGTEENRVFFLRHLQPGFVRPRVKEGTVAKDSVLACGTFEEEHLAFLLPGGRDPEGQVPLFVACPTECDCHLHHEEEKRQDENFIRNLCAYDASQVDPTGAGAEECETLFNCFAPLTGCFPLLRTLDEQVKNAAWYCLRKFNQLQGDCTSERTYRATTYQDFSQFRMLFAMLDLPQKFSSDLSQSGGLEPGPIPGGSAGGGNCSALAVIDAYLEHTKNCRRKDRQPNAYFSLAFIVNTLIQRKWLYSRVAQRRAAAFLFRASTWCVHESLAKHMVAVGHRALA